LKKTNRSALGDRVLVVFDDEPGRHHTLVISTDRTDAALGIYSVEHSVGKALLGAMVEDEIPIAIGDKTRNATILGIAKPSQFN
jgi:transcription elongation GreA/GreB family factor